MEGLEFLRRLIPTNGRPAFRTLTARQVLMQFVRDRSLHMGGALAQASTVIADAGLPGSVPATWFPDGRCRLCTDVSGGRAPRDSSSRYRIGGVKTMVPRSTLLKLTNDRSERPQARAVIVANRTSSSSGWCRVCGVRLSNTGGSSAAICGACDAVGQQQGRRRTRIPWAGR